MPILWVKSVFFFNTSVPLEITFGTFSNEELQRNPFYVHVANVQHFVVPIAVYFKSPKITFAILILEFCNDRKISNV